MALDVNLAKVREAAGLSLSELSAKCSISIASLNRFEKGLRPGKESLALIRRALVAATKARVVSAQRALKLIESGALDAE